MTCKHDIAKIEVDISKRSKFKVIVTTRLKKSNNKPCMVLESESGLILAMIESYTPEDVANFAVLAELWNEMSDDPKILSGASTFKMVKDDVQA